MRLVVDANVVFSALLKKGASRKIISDRRIVLFAPLALLKEIEKYAGELKKRSGLQSRNFLELTKTILSRIRMVEDREIEPFLPAAKHLCIDPNDVAYVACALAVNAELWSRDRHLKQPRIKCWNTEELGRKLELI